MEEVRIIRGNSADVFDQLDACSGKRVVVQLAFDASYGRPEDDRCIGSLTIRGRLGGVLKNRRLFRILPDFLETKGLRGHIDCIQCPDGDPCVGGIPIWSIFSEIGYGGYRYSLSDFTVVPVEGEELKVSELGIRLQIPLNMFTIKVLE